MIGQFFNGYTIIRLLGSGGMADVYNGENGRQMPAAIKVLKEEFKKK